MTEPAPPLRTGIVGLGHIGAVHVEAIERTPGLVLTACCDRDERLRALVPRLVPFYVDAGRMLEEVDLDVVVIATPNDTHESLVARCASADVDVILEKPSAGSVEGLDAIAARFDRSGKLLYHALHAQHGLEMELFRSFVQRSSPRDLGPLTSFSCIFHDPYVDRSGIKARAASLSDCWIDSGINALSVLGRIVGLRRLEVIDRTTGRLPSGGPTVQSTVVLRIYGSATASDPDTASQVAGMGSINTSWIDAEDRKRTWLSFGSSGTEVLLDHSAQSMLVREPGRPLRNLTAPGSDRPRLLNHYLGLFRDFIDCRRHGRSNSDAARTILGLLYGGEG